jgi:FkbM family methyltransferase
MLTVVNTVLREPITWFRRLVFERNYRTFLVLQMKLGGTQRFTECRLKLHDWNLLIPDAASFLSTYSEIFVEQIYKIRFSCESPYILDLGANIGLSILYFKMLCPKAQITAFEADPRIFSYLEHNIKSNGYSDVALVNKAIWYENVSLQFSPEGGDGGRIAWDGEKSTVEVQAQDIRQLLKGRTVDFLKMDIEGAENSILPACHDCLSAVRNIFVEYHSRVDEHQYLDKVISVLAEAGFRLHLQSAFCSPTPYVERRVHSGYDLQLNIFGWREHDL